MKTKILKIFIFILLITMVIGSGWLALNPHNAEELIQQATLKKQVVLDYFINSETRYLAQARQTLENTDSYTRIRLATSPVQDQVETKIKTNYFYTQEEKSVAKANHYVIIGVPKALNSLQDLTYEDVTLLIESYPDRKKDNTYVEKNMKIPLEMLSTAEAKQNNIIKQSENTHEKDNIIVENKEAYLAQLTPKNKYNHGIFTTRYREDKLQNLATKFTPKYFIVTGEIKNADSDYTLFSNAKVTIKIDRLTKEIISEEYIDLENETNRVKYIYKNYNKDYFLPTDKDYIDGGKTSDRIKDYIDLFNEL